MKAGLRPRLLASSESPGRHGSIRPGARSTSGPTVGAEARMEVATMENLRELTTSDDQRGRNPARTMDPQRALMTPLPTYDRRHPAPVVPVRRTSLGPSIVRKERRPIAMTVALILIRGPRAEEPRSSRGTGPARGDRDDALASAIDARNEALATAATLSDRVGGLPGGVGSGAGSGDEPRGPPGSNPG